MTVTTAKTLLIIFGLIGQIASTLEMFRIHREKITDLSIITIVVIGLAISIFSIVLGLVL